MKKLFCVSVKHENDESETLFHIKTETIDRAKEFAANDYAENHGFYQGDLELFKEDENNGDVVIYAFEIRETDIIEL